MSILGKDMDIDVVTNSAEETIALGRRVGEQLRGGEVFAVCGELGSGKTHLIKGIAAGVGAGETREVNSPTFVLVNEYSGRFDIYHVDAYRLETVEEFENIGFDDLCYDGSVVLVEWADKFEKILGQIKCVRIKLEHAGETQREIHIKNTPEYVIL